MTSLVRAGAGLSAEQVAENIGPNGACFIGNPVEPTSPAVES